MIRRPWTIASLLGLFVSVVPWATAGIIYAVESGGHSCLAFGYGNGESWLISIVVYPDGFAMIQSFPENLSRHDGFYCKMSRMHVRHNLTWKSVLPRSMRGRVGKTMFFHLGLPLAIFGTLSGYALISPVVRRRKRKKHGLCVGCGYDLRASEDRCPECNFPIEAK